MDSFRKQNSESFFVDADFTNVLSTGETLVLGDCSVEAVDVNGDDVASTVTDQDSLAVDGNKLKIRVQAGTEAASPYKLTFKATTSGANVWEKDVHMRIREV